MKQALYSKAVMGEPAEFRWRQNKILIRRVDNMEQVITASSFRASIFHMVFACSNELMIHSLSPSGNQIWNVYHFSSSLNVACDGSRETAVQQVGKHTNSAQNVKMVFFTGWHSDGSPDLGVPRALADAVPEPA